MKYAVLADIHANLEALTACLAHAALQGADRHVFLGDMVGYGADPCACLDLVREHAAAGALVVRGNHDEAAVGGLCVGMQPVAREAAIWTRQQLAEDERRFLDSLPHVMESDDCLFVHASADRPERWEYIAGERAALRCLAATRAAMVCVGHVHHPGLFHTGRNGVTPFAPATAAPITLTPGRRWLVLAGSVGQPRDGNPAASYVLLDTMHRQASFQRVPYDWMRAAQKIRAAGLPAELALRLEHGE